MVRLPIVLCLMVFLASADEAAKPRELRARYTLGERYTCSNTVTYSVKVTVRQAERETSSSESVQRTERFVDKVVRAGDQGVLEIERSYLRLYTKARSGDDERPTVIKSPLSGRRVMLRERQRRRDLKVEGRATMDPLLRRTAGIEIDWRDIFPDDPVAPGDEWDADAGVLARRLSAYLSSGHRSKMKVRYEANVERAGSQRAKLYVDWQIEGMRDKSLFTKVVLAGDVYFDFALRRVVEVDLAGSIIVRGAILGEGQPKIVKGEGPVSFKTSIKPAPVEAAADGEE